MKRTVVGVALASAVAISLQSPAQAGYDGAMSTAEYNWIDTTIPDANTQAEVKNHCNCSGVNFWTGTHNDNPAKANQYKWNNGYDDSTVTVFYVQRDGSSAWTVYTKFYCSHTDPCHEGDD